MFKEMRKLAKTKPAGFILYWIVRLYCATLRMKIENEEEWFSYLENGGNVLICGWHQQFFAGVRLVGRYRKYQPALMSSKSMDGQIAGGIAGRAGFYTVWGSSSRSASAALKGMIRRLRDYHLAAHIIDGPRGPAGEAKLGAIAIANVARAVLVPAIITSDRAWYMRSWDKFMIPKPFARVTVKYLSVIKLPPKMDKEELEKQRKKLEVMMRPYLKL